MVMGKKYHSDYYRKNRRSKLTASRRRYRDDQKYREDIKSRARQRYRDTKKEPEEGTQYASIGQAAKLVGLSTKTLRTYQSKGIVPRALVMNSRGWGLYSIHQVALMRRVFNRLRDSGDSGVKSLADVHKILFNEWRNEDATKKSR